MYLQFDISPPPTNRAGSSSPQKKGRWKGLPKGRGRRATQTGISYSPPMTWRVANPTVMNTLPGTNRNRPLRIDGVGRGKFAFWVSAYFQGPVNMWMFRGVYINKIISRELDNWSHKNCKHPEKKLSMCLGHYITNPDLSHFWWLNSQISFYDTNPKDFL